MAKELQDAWRPAGAETPAPVTPGDVELFRLILARSGEAVESELRGKSMERAIPAGSRIRIVHHEDAEVRLGQVVAFLAGSRVMVHRVVYRGSRGPARGFVITHGDGNWLCDPPVELACIAGSVDEFCVDGEWKPIGPARTSLARRAVAFPAFALLRGALEVNPAAAARLARGISLARMRARGIWHALRRRGRPDVRD